MTNGLSGPRKQFLDVLRVLATCAVVLMHVLTGATDVTDASIVPEYRSLLLSVMDLVTWCVPIFLLISGYLFLNPERTLKNIAGGLRWRSSYSAFRMQLPSW